MSGAANTSGPQPADDTEFSLTSFTDVVNSIAASGEKITAEPDLILTVSLPADAENAVPASAKTKIGGAK